MNGDVRDMWNKWYEIGVALKIPTSDLDSLPGDAVEAKSEVNVSLSPSLPLSPSPFLPSSLNPSLLSRLNINLVHSLYFPCVHRLCLACGFVTKVPLTTHPHGGCCWEP